MIWRLKPRSTIWIPLTAWVVIFSVGGAILSAIGFHHREVDPLVQRKTITWLKEPPSGRYSTLEIIDDRIIHRESGEIVDGRYEIFMTWSEPGWERPHGLVVTYDELSAMTVGELAEWIAGGEEPSGHTFFEATTALDYMKKNATLQAFTFSMRPFRDVEYGRSHERPLGDLFGVAVQVQAYTFLLLASLALVAGGWLVFTLRARRKRARRRDGFLPAQE